MFVVQYNSRQCYQSKMIRIETTSIVKAGIEMIPKPFIGHQDISPSKMNYYWQQSEKREIRVMTAKKKALVDKIIIDHRTDLINYPFLYSWRFLI